MSFISLDIAAALTGVSKRTLWRRIAAGTLTASRGGGGGGGGRADPGQSG